MQTFFQYVMYITVKVDMHIFDSQMLSMGGKGAVDFIKEFIYFWSMLCKFTQFPKSSIVDYVLKSQKLFLTTTDHQNYTLSEHLGTGHSMALQ
jgi:hypothetical protein